jgi:hypothetical protein
MKAPLLSLAVLLCLAQAAASPDVFAQSGNPDPQLIQARARFEEGVKFYDAGKYEQARAAFLQTYVLKQDAGILLNLALSCLKSGHILDAQRYFKQFLNEAPNATAAEKSAANEGLTQAQAAAGHIEVTAPAKGTITVDGTDVGAAPLAEPVAVDPGDHTVTLKTPDGIAQTQRLTVRSGEKAAAHFKEAAVTGGAGPAPEPANPPAANPPPATPPAANPPAAPAHDESAPPAAPPKESDSGTGGFTPPHNLVPLFILGGTAVVGYALAIGFFVAEGSAHDNANKDQAFIRANAPAGSTSVNCSNPPASLTTACHALVSDNDAANKDAIVAGVALGVGIAATIGGVVYLFVADKGSKTADERTPVIYPLVGSGAGGLGVAGRF